VRTDKIISLGLLHGKDIKKGNQWEKKSEGLGKVVDVGCGPLGVEGNGGETSVNSA